jgi:hypothetical protein
MAHGGQASDTTVLSLVAQMEVEIESHDCKAGARSFQVTYTANEARRLGV